MRAKSSILKTLSLPHLRRRFRVHQPGPITAVDVDGQVLRVAQASLRGSRVVVSRIVVERLDLAPDADRSDPAVLGHAIAKAFEHARIKPTPVVMGIPRAMVVIRTLLLPVIEDIRELASMVHLQVGKDLPFRLDEAVIDFKLCKRLSPLPKTETSATEQNHPGGDAQEAASDPPKFEILAAVVKRDVVGFYEKMALAAGLKLSGLGWLSYANARVVDASQLTLGEEAVALVSLRPDEVSVDIVAQQSLLFSRGASVKLPHSLATPPMMDESASPDPRSQTSSTETAPMEPSEPRLTFAEGAAIEVVRSLHSYAGMEAQNPVVKVVVAGASGQESAVVETLKKRLKLPCSLFDSANKLDLPKVAREHASSCISAIGLSLGACDPHGLSFDFLNPKRPAVQRNLRRIRLIAAAAIAFAVLLVLLGVRTHLVNKRMIINRALQAELTEARKKRPLYTQMRRQAATVQDWIKGGQNWLEHYAYLSAILPASEDLYITSFQVSGQGTIRLAVQARSGEILARLDKQLRAAGYEVKPLAITPGADKNGYSFRSTVELIVPGKLAIDLSKVRAPARPEDDVSLERSLKKTVTLKDAPTLERPPRRTAPQRREAP